MLGQRSAAGFADLDADDRPVPRTLTRRKDIQGLRAVAVVVVVLFHAGLPVPGGFVGVDAFFVISGFVITAMLQREWASTGRLSFGRFYLRRFKRLTPALALMVTVTMLGSVLLLSPLGPRQTVAKTGFAAMLMSANVVIARTTGNYFDAPAATNPLLHTWSLSVEEQFYLVFPVLLLIGWKLSARSARPNRAVPAWIGFVALVSFSIAVSADHGILSSRPDLVTGFYSPVSRTWEFAAGALLAFATPRLEGLSKQVATAAGALGALLLLASLYAISQSTPFPGPWTLLPVVATLLLLGAGVRGSPVSRLLAGRAMVKVGDWSYSIYLWHWPFIVFATVRWPGSSSAVVAAAVLSLLPALASYRWLETPIRAVEPRRGRSTIVLVVAVIVPALALSLATFREANGERDSLTASGDQSAYRGEIAWQDHDYRFGGFYPCTADALRSMVEAAPNYEPRCQQSKPGKDVDFAVIGDSHAEQLFIGLMEALPERNIMYFATPSAPTTSNAQYAAAFDYAAHTDSIDTVLVTAFWKRRGVQADDLESVLRPLVDRGKSVFLTDDVPDFPFDPFGCKYRSNPLVPAKCSIDAGSFRASHQPIADQLAAMEHEVPGVELLETSRYLCDTDECSMTSGDEILYADPTHLNVLGSKYVGERLAADVPELRDR